MSITVSEPMRDWVEAQVEAGKYASAGDYILDLIRRDQEAIDDDEHWLTELHQAIDAGLADEAAGRLVDAEEVFARLEAKYSARAA